MTLAIRVIPSMLVRDGQLVQGERFDSWRIVGNPLQAAKIHDARGVDELLYLDVGATPASKGPDFKLIERLTREFFSPLTVGGGVRHIKDIKDLFNAGADKVLIGTNANALVPEASTIFGAQAIVVSLDVSGSRVCFKCGQESSPYMPVSWAQKMERLGAGELLVQDISRDGMQRGYNLDLIKKVSDAVTIPVIASCGAGSYDHMLEAVKAGASAVASGSCFQFTDHTPKGAAQHMAEHGLPART